MNLVHISKESSRSSSTCSPCFTVMFLQLPEKTKRKLPFHFNSITAKDLQPILNKMAQVKKILFQPVLLSSTTHSLG